MINCLILDDNNNHSHILSDFLQSENINTMIAHREDQAIHILQNTPIDILLLDRIIQGKDTIESIPIFKQLKHDLKIIVLSAIPYNKSTVKYAHILKYINKPFDFNELLSAMYHKETKAVRLEIKDYKLT